MPSSQSSIAAPGTRLTGGEALVRELVARGVETVFCVPGESYLAVLDAFHDVAAELQVIVCRHEAGAANMAEAWGKLTNRPGICFVTRGPGACHGSIGVHTAKQDSTPMLFFVGQVPRDQRGREAFQEVDYRQTFGDLAKWATEIDDADRIPEVLGHAFTVAVSGRPGPVVIALPEDMLCDITTVTPAPAVAPPDPAPSTEALARLRDMLAAAERPLVLLGGSSWSDQGMADLARFIAANGLPVGCGFRRQHLFDNRDPHYVGDSAIGINPKLKQRIAEADLILAIGTRLGEIVTDGYTNLTVPVPQQTLVHVHRDANELGRVYAPSLGIAADLNRFAAEAAAQIQMGGAQWRAWCAAGRADYEAWQQPIEFVGPVDMAGIVRWLSHRLPEDAVIANGAGNYAIWLHRFFRYKQHGTQLAPTSGAMGYGLPAAIAAKIAHPDRMVLAWLGDGEFMMTCQELATVARYALDITVVVINNGSYGTIRMHQERHYPKRVMATDLTNPDFVAFAQSFGLNGYRVTATGEFAAAFEAAQAAPGASLIEVILPTAELSPGMKLAEA